MIVIALVVVVGAVALIHQRLATAASTPSATPTPALVGGTTLSNTPIPAMSLRDQSGAVISNKSLLGRPAIVTFMDMTCTQECPIQAQLLNQTAIFMGAQKAAQVNWVVVSVNPTNTPADANAFMSRNKVTIPVKVLMGSEAQLQPVWNAYHIYVQPTPTDVNHTVALFLIDKSGHERMIFVDGFDPKALSQDLTALLAQ
jgi:protein SCO1/2